jgi:AcrR family transcriptional regulator
MTETSDDGRLARGQRTREAVIDALFDLYAEGNLTPTIEDIASRVGRTTRSIYTHFQDKEALAVAMA